MNEWLYNSEHTLQHSDLSTSGRVVDSREAGEGSMGGHESRRVGSHEWSCAPPAQPCLPPGLSWWIYPPPPLPPPPPPPPPAPPSSPPFLQCVGGWVGGYSGRPQRHEANIRPYLTKHHHHGHQHQD